MFADGSKLLLPMGHEFSDGRRMAWNLVMQMITLEL